ncbi:hypothetical protein AB6735_17345 [Mucilaginibacter sp. RCC_168]|uniref:hypothetical protein n=1 Tax=Mucilaginibacter sp. RCC_168 TaxID=3239221 RepID=UPI003525DAA5
MEESKIKQLWQEYDLKLEKSLQLNYKIIREMQTKKIEDHINSFRRNQVLGVVAGILFTVSLGFLVINSLNNIYFAISIGLIALFNIFAVASYLRHLIMLERISIADTITGTQEKLAAIQSSLNMVGRIMILQTPFWCTFWYNQQLVDHGGATFWAINLTVLALFTILSVYLFNTLTYKNIHRKWVRSFVESFGGKKIIKAMEFLKEIEEYKMEG